MKKTAKITALCAALMMMCTVPSAYAGAEADMKNAPKTAAVMMNAAKSKKKQKYGVMVKHYRSIVKETGKLLTNPQYSLYDITGDGIPELFVSTGDAHVNGVEIYSSDNKKYVKKSAGNQDMTMKHTTNSAVTGKHIIIPKTVLL